jgi:hypothetical protein
MSTVKASTGNDTSRASSGVVGLWVHRVWNKTLSPISDTIAVGRRRSRPFYQPGQASKLIFQAPPSSLDLIERRSVRWRNGQMLDQQDHLRSQSQTEDPNQT